MRNDDVLVNEAVSFLLVLGIIVSVDQPNDTRPRIVGLAVVVVAVVVGNSFGVVFVNLRLCVTLIRTSQQVSLGEINSSLPLGDIIFLAFQAFWKALVAFNSSFFALLAAKS